jgi:hypothetical protein
MGWRFLSCGRMVAVELWGVAGSYPVEYVANLVEILNTGNVSMVIDESNGETGTFGWETGLLGCYILYCRVRD